MSENNKKVISNVNSKGKEERNVPDLRFSFRDEWLISTIGNHITQEGKKAKGSELDYTPFSVNNENGFSIQREQWGGASYVSDSKEGYKVVKKSNIAYNPARINVGSIGLFSEDVGIVSSLYVIFSTKKNLLPEFLYQYMKSKKFNKTILKLQEGGVRSYFFFDKLCSSKINIPSLCEQKKIVVFLSLINERIESQKKIISNIESQIKSIKSQLFNVTTGGKRSLSDILDEVSLKSTINNQYPVVSSTVKGLVLQSEYFDKEIASNENTGYKIITKGNIIISPQNLWMGNITFNNKFESGIVSPSYKIFKVKESYNKLYVFELMTTTKAFYLYKTVSEQGASVVRRNLNFEAFMQLSFNIPGIKVQNKVITILYYFKDKYENEKKILSLYVRQKQYLLDKMFI